MRDIENAKKTYRRYLGKVTIEGHDMGYFTSQEIIKVLSEKGLDITSEPIFDNNKNQIGEILAVYKIENI